MKVFIFHAHAGQGHRQVAETIGRQIENDHADWDVEVHDALNFTHGYFKKIYPETYYNSVKYTPKLWGWSYDFTETKLGTALIYPLRRAGNHFVGKKLLEKVVREKPDVIICTHFFSAQLLSRAKSEGLIDAQIIVVITDFIPHQFWINQGTDLYWVMSDESKQNLLSRAIDENQIHVGGIPIDNKFLPQGNKNALLEKWDFAAGKFTVLISSGSFGLGPTEDLLEVLQMYHDRIQVFVVCGHNNTLKERLEKQSFEIPVKIFGFINFMADLMEASDLLIAKCGGSTTCESLAKGIPLVVLDPIPGQETGNADVLQKRGASFLIENTGEIKVILDNIFKYSDLIKNKRKAISQLAKPHAVNDLVRFIEDSANPPGGKTKL